MKTWNKCGLGIMLAIYWLVLGACGGGGGGGGSLEPVSTDVLPTSVQIQAVQDSADGVGLGLPIDGAIVTYVRPALGIDVAGFFLQAEQSGPAVFVAIDPSTLTPSPAVGDKVSMMVDEVATTGNLREIVAVSSFTRLAQGEDVTGLVQDLTSATDVVAMLDSYESELIRITSATIRAGFSSAGTGFVKVQIDTPGIVGDPGLTLRVPADFVTDLGLEAGCEIALGDVPLWRFVDEVQATAWSGSDISVTSCSAPVVTAAFATSATSVRVVMSRSVDGDSITSPSAQFVIDNGLVVSAAVVAGNVVDLTTNTQVEGLQYTVTVAASVVDLLGAGVDPLANSAGFKGFTSGFPTGSSPLIINEIDYDNVGSDVAEFVEILNVSADSIDLTGLELVLINGNGLLEYNAIDLSPAGTLNSGEYLVIGSSNVLGADILFELPADNVQNGSPDGLAIVDRTAQTVFDAMSYEGEITAATIVGFVNTVNLVEGTASLAEDSGVSDGSLSRCMNGQDTDVASSDWAFAPVPTPGSANVCNQ